MNAVPKPTTTPPATPYLRTITLTPDEITERCIDWPGNARIHDDDLLDESVDDHGQYRSVLARELPDGRLQFLGGHGTKDALLRRGLPVDIEVRDVPDVNKARRIVLIDNRSNDRARYDDPALVKLLTEADQAGGLAGTGWDTDTYRDLLDRLDSGNPFDYREGAPAGPGDARPGDPDGGGEDRGPGPDGGAYTTAVNIPQYEIVGPCPEVTALRDETRADALRARIRAADVPADIREYLLAAANRHTVFNYRLAAEYYPHATPEVQRLMEESALVIIDIGDAIRLGYAKLVAAITELHEKDTTDVP